VFSLAGPRVRHDVAKPDRDRLLKRQVEALGVAPSPSPRRSAWACVYDLAPEVGARLGALEEPHHTAAILRRAVEEVRAVRGEEMVREIDVDARLLGSSMWLMMAWIIGNKR
jgi:hypothetical protein